MSEPPEKQLKQTKKILVLGGNGFIGGETVHQLLGKGGSDVTVVNRGKWDWDYERRIKPYVSSLICDREEQSLSTCLPANVTYDAVIDFSAYRPEAVEDALSSLDGRFRLYVYISTDSIYEVCEKNHSSFTKETDDKRPSDANEQRRLRKLDSYGHKKLLCEEVIRRRSEQRELQFIILRLSDVFGPRDSTERWWPYQMWMQFYSSIAKPIYLPSSVADKASSLVFVEDVARLVVSILDLNPHVYNEAYNLAYEQTFTLRQLLHGIAAAVKADNVAYQDDGYHAFPSVLRGPVDVQKAKERLNWTTTPWKEALAKTVEFNCDATCHHLSERQSIVKDMLKDIIAKENHVPFIKAINDYCSDWKIKYQ